MITRVQVLSHVVFQQLSMALEMPSHLEVLQVMHRNVHTIYRVISYILFRIHFGVHPHPHLLHLHPHRSQSCSAHCFWGGLRVGGVTLWQQLHQHQ